MQITNQLSSPIPVGTKLRWILPPDYQRLVDLGLQPDVSVVVTTTGEEELIDHISSAWFVPCKWTDANGKEWHGSLNCFFLEPVP